MAGCRRRSFTQLAIAATLVWATSLAPVPKLQACPFCPAQLTLTEQMGDANAAVLARWVGSEKDTESEPGITTFKIQQIAKGPTSLAKFQQITVPRFLQAKPDDQFLVLGFDLGSGAGLEWGSPVEITENSFRYLSEAPTSKSPPAERLVYFLKYLESSDTIVSNDAFGEFANAEYQDIEKLASKLPREKLRKWIADPKTPAVRLGLYGMLLGLCGDEADAKALESLILVETDEFRLGIDGLIGGYLLIMKDKGLDVLDKHKLSNKKIPFSETFAAMQGLRFIWTYSPNSISPERLRQSMRILLDRPEMTDLVIADLARWKDWSVREQLVQKYGKGEYNTSSIKRAIVRYLLVCSKDVPTDSGAPMPVHVAQAQKRLDELRKQDPKTVTEAERFFIFP